MIIELKHNPKYFKSESMEKWNRIWKKKIEYHWFILVISILILIMAISMILSSNKVGFMFFSISLFGIFVTINFLNQAKKKKQKYFDQVNKISDRHFKQDIPSSWYFEEGYLGYKDYQFEAKTQWSAFSHFYVKEKALFLFLTDREESAYSISEGEIGFEKFNEIIDFVKGKINVNLAT